MRAVEACASASTGVRRRMRLSARRALIAELVGSCTGGSRAARGCSNGSRAAIHRIEFRGVNPATVNTELDCHFFADEDVPRLMDAFISRSRHDGWLRREATRRRRQAI